MEKAMMMTGSFNLLSLEDDYLKWVPKILKSIADHYEVDMAETKLGSEPHIPMFNVEILENKPLQHRRSTVKGTKSFSRISTSKPLFQGSQDVFKFEDDVRLMINSDKAQVSNNTVTIPRQCYHIELNLKGTGLTYKTGDHVGVYASNSHSSVMKLAKFLGIKDINTFINLKSNPSHRLASTSKPQFDVPASIHDIMTNHLDINAVLKQHHFEVN
jgi:NADPH-ferrihemoprotein reductase